MRPDHVGRFTLAVAPVTRGFGFALFENADTLIDWGVKGVRNDKNEDALNRLNELIHIYQPGVLVVEDADADTSRRDARIRALIDAMTRRAEAAGLSVYRYPRTMVCRYFGGEMRISKDEIAAHVAAALPELAPRLPRKRRLWENERHSMAIFEAAALALTHFGAGR